MSTLKALSLAAMMVSAGSCGVHITEGREQPASVHQTYAVDMKERHERGARVLAARESIRISTVKFPTNCTPLGCYCTKVGDDISNFQSDTAIQCTSPDLLTDQKKQWLGSVIDDAVTWLQKAFKLDRSTSPIKVTTPNNVCGLNSRGAGVTIDQQNIGFVDTDFVIYVTAVPAQGLTQAWAVDCQHDQNGRPTVALINFSPSAFDTTSTATVNYENAVSTAIHELMHALGFGSNFYEKNGWFPTNSGKATTTRTGIDGTPVTVMNTPKVIAKAKTHFGCNTMTGVELENQGGPGTAGSHWEKRILGAESMTGIQTAEKSVISEFTLAYFEDTGVYDVDYTAAQHLEWGKNRGCDFVNKKCNDASNLFRDEFCFPTTTKTTELLDSCTISRLGYGRCNIQSFTDPLPSEYQYFSSDSTVGGGAFLTDYCPYRIPTVQCTDPHAQSVLCDTFDQVTCTANSASCSYDTSVNKCLSIERSILGQVFGDSSRCFTTDLKKNGWNINTHGNARCFTVKCSDDLSSYNIITHNGHTLYCDDSMILAEVPSDLSNEYSQSDVVCAPVSSICGPSQWKVDSVPSASIVRPSRATPIPPTSPPPTPVPGPSGGGGAATESSDDDNFKIAIILVAVCCGLAVIIGIGLVWKVCRSSSSAPSKKSSFSNSSTDYFIAKPTPPVFNTPAASSQGFEPKKPTHTPPSAGTNYLVSPPHDFFISPRDVPKPLPPSANYYSPPKPVR